MENKEETTKLRAGIYIRVSSDDQLKGYGPELQLEESLFAAVERDGCEVKKEHIFIDSKTGSTDDRPDWKKLIEVAKRGGLDVVYFWKLDRMMRDEYFFYVNEKSLKDLNVQLRFATQNLEDPFNRAIQVAVAAEERRKILERTYGGRKRALRDKKWVARVPYGYSMDQDTKTLKINKKEAEWVKQIFQWFVEDRLPLTALGNRVYTHKIPTKYDLWKKNKPRYGYGFWSKGMLGRLLTREYYATGIAWFHKYKNPDRKRFGNAELRPEKEWIKVPIPPIISIPLFEKAQKQLLRNREFARRRTKRDYLFAKKLICGTCKTKLTANCRTDRADAKFYRGDAWSEKRCMDCRYYLEEDLDTAIWNNIIQFFRDPNEFMARLEKFRNRGSKKHEVEKKEKILAKLKEEMDKEERILLEAELKGFYSPKLLTEKKKKLEAARKNLLEEEEDLNKIKLMAERQAMSIESAESLYKKIQGYLDTPTYVYQTRKKIFEKLIDKVILSGRTAEVWLNIPPQESVSNFMSAFPPENKDDEDNSLLSSASQKHSDTNGMTDQLRPVPFIKRDSNGIKTDLLRPDSCKQGDTKGIPDQLRPVPYVKCDTNPSWATNPVIFKINLPKRRQFRGRPWKISREKEVPQIKNA